MSTILRTGVVCTKRGRNKKDYNRVLRLAEVVGEGGFPCCSCRFLELVSVSLRLRQPLFVSLPDQDMETLEWAAVSDFKIGIQVVAVEEATDGGPGPVTTISGVSRSIKIIPQVSPNPSPL